MLDLGSTVLTTFCMSILMSFQNTCFTFELSASFPWTDNCWGFVWGSCRRCFASHYHSWICLSYSLIPILQNFTLQYIQFQLDFQPRKPHLKPFNNFNLSLRTKLHTYILISESLINFYDNLEALSGQYAQSKKIQIFECKYTVFLFQTSYRTL